MSRKRDMGKGLRILRLMNDLTMTDLSKRTGLAVKIISQLEKNSIAFNPSYQKAIAKAYHLDSIPLLELGVLGGGLKPKVLFQLIKNNVTSKESFQSEFKNIIKDKIFKIKSDALKDFKRVLFMSN